MSPRHFARYAKNQPKEYEAFSNAMWNGFVSITHTMGLSKFFSFSPEDLHDQDPQGITKTDSIPPK